MKETLIKIFCICALMFTFGVSVYLVTGEKFDKMTYAYDAWGASAQSMDVAFQTAVAGSRVYVGKASVDSGGTSVVVAVPGASTKSLAFVTPNTNGGRSILSAVPATNQVTVTMSGEVNTTTTLCLQVWR